MLRSRAVTGSQLGLNCGISLVSVGSPEFWASGHGPMLVAARRPLHACCTGSPRGGRCPACSHPLPQHPTAAGAADEHSSAAATSAAAVHTFFCSRRQPQEAGQCAANLLAHRLRLAHGFDMRLGHTAAPLSGFESLVTRCMMPAFANFRTCVNRQLRIVCAMTRAWIVVEIVRWRVACGGWDERSLKTFDHKSFRRLRARGFSTSSMRPEVTSRLKPRILGFDTKEIYRDLRVWPAPAV